MLISSSPKTQQQHQSRVSPTPVEEKMTLNDKSQKTPTDNSVGAGISALKSLLSSHVDSDEDFLNELEYVQRRLELARGTFSASSGGETAKDEETNLSNNKECSVLVLKRALDERELELNADYLANVEAVNDRLHGFAGKIRAINGISTELTEKILSNKEKSRELLQKTSVLQTEKKQLNARQAYFNEFFGKYALRDDEERALAADPISELFQRSFVRLREVLKNAKRQSAIEPDFLALKELTEQLGEQQQRAYEALFRAVQHECRLLGGDFVDIKPGFVRALELLQNRGDLFVGALDEYANARRGHLVKAFIDTLTKGARTGLHERPIEHLSSDSLRYTNEMLAWIGEAMTVERETLGMLVRNCLDWEKGVGTLERETTGQIADALCQPLRLRLEQATLRESNAVMLYRLATLFLHYARQFDLLVLTCDEMAELAQNMFFSAVTSAIQRILTNMRVPDYDLMPVPAVHQALLLLRDILDSQHDNAFAAVVDKKAMHAKIFTHILDPLYQAVQLASASMDNALEVAVYTINCLDAIRSVIALYQYTDQRLEMIRALIEANEDVLVSDQASRILEETGLMPVYTRCQSHQPKQGPMSALAGAETGAVRSALERFFGQFVSAKQKFGLCPQFFRISAIRTRESVVKRTHQAVVHAYAQIYAKLSDKANGYPTTGEDGGDVENNASSLPLKTPEELERLLLNSTVGEQTVHDHSSISKKPDTSKTVALPPEATNTSVAKEQPSSSKVL